MLKLLCGIVNELNPTTRLADQKTKTLLSYFFCQATDERINNATAVLRGLIYLLVKQQPVLVPHVRERYKDTGKRLFEDVNAWTALSEILTSILNDPIQDRTYVMIDALDECVTGLRKLLDFIGKKSCLFPRVKWIVSSRNWPDIEEQLETATQKVRLCLELNEKSISAAVNSYIQYQVNQLTRRKKYDNKTRAAVHRRLSLQANRTILWVAMVCQNLEKIPTRKVLAALKAFPPGLDPLYKRMMDQIGSLDDVDDVDLCYQILASVILVYRPVTLAELSSLVEFSEDYPTDADSHQEAVDEEDTPADADILQEVTGLLQEEDPPAYADLRQVIGLCGSFLTVRNGQVFIIHQSAKDYLSDKAASIIFPSGRGDSHCRIFQRSLDAMRKSLRRDMYELHHPGISIDNIKVPAPDPLAPLRYCCAHWVEHLYEAQHQGDLQHRDDLRDGRAVDKFLRGFLLYWVEAMSLCRAISDAVFAIAKLERLLKASLTSYLTVVLNLLTYYRQYLANPASSR